MTQKKGIIFGKKRKIHVEKMEDRCCKRCKGARYERKGEWVRK